MNTDIVSTLTDYCFYLNNYNTTRALQRDHTRHCSAQVVDSCSGTGPECCITHHQRSSPNKANFEQGSCLSTIECVQPRRDAGASDERRPVEYREAGRARARLGGMQCASS